MSNRPMIGNMGKLTEEEAGKLIAATGKVIGVTGFLGHGRGLTTWLDGVAIMQDEGYVGSDMAGMAAMGLVQAGSALGRWAKDRGWEPEDKEKWPEFGPYESGSEPGLSEREIACRALAAAGKAIDDAFEQLGVD